MDFGMKRQSAEYNPSMLSNNTEFFRHQYQPEH